MILLTVSLICSRSPSSLHNVSFPGQTGYQDHNESFGFGHDSIQESDLAARFPDVFPTM